MFLQIYPFFVLADAESGFQPGGENLDGAKCPVEFDRFRHAGVKSGRQYSRSVKPGTYRC